MSKDKLFCCCVRLSKMTSCRIFGQNVCHIEFEGQKRSVWKFSKQELILTVISTPSSPIPSKCDAALSIHLMFCSTSKVGRFQFIAPGLHRYIAMCKLCTLQFIGVQLENIPSTFPYSSIEDQLHLCLEVDLARVFSGVISRSCIRCLHLWPRPMCSNFPWNKLLEIQDLVGVMLRPTLLHELKNKNMPYHVFQLSLEQVVTDSDGI